MLASLNGAVQRLRASSASSSSPSTSSSSAGEACSSSCTSAGEEATTSTAMGDLLGLYRNLPSPPGSFADSTRELDELSPAQVDLLWHAFADSAPQGITTPLFAYQRATLARMLQRELAPQRFRHPAALDGKLDFRGGILAEDMGSGKTLMILALVCATRRTMPVTDELVLTPLSETFPFDRERENRIARLSRPPPLVEGYMLTSREWTAHEARCDAYQDKVNEIERESSKMPSLHDLMLSFIRTRGVPYRDKAHAHPHLVEKLDRQTPYYVELTETPMTKRSQEITVTSQKIFLSHATLLVVPAELLLQWRDEIHKHVKDKFLSVWTVHTAKDKIPSIEDLPSVDILLMSTYRFAAFGRVETPSYLIERVHWRRLIIDEGHSVARANGLSGAAERVRASSRWIATGTPTAHLRASSVGDTASTAPPPPAEGLRSDLNHLGELFQRFFKASYMHSRSWWLQLTTAYFAKDKHADMMQAILETAVVRHQPSDLRRSYELPSMSSRVVRLKFTPLERLTYNVLVALFLANAIESQRSDQDYLFHPNNRRRLLELFVNLRVSTTFFTSPDALKWVSWTVKHLSEQIGTPKEQSWSDRDRDDFRAALGHLHQANGNDAWKAHIAGLSVDVAVKGLSPELRTLGMGHSDNAGTDFLHLPQALLLRERLNSVRSKTEPTIDGDDLTEELITAVERWRADRAMPTKATAAATPAAPKVSLIGSFDNPLDLMAEAAGLGGNSIVLDLDALPPLPPPEEPRVITETPPLLQSTPTTTTKGKKGKARKGKDESPRKKAGEGSPRKKVAWRPPPIKPENLPLLPGSFSSKDATVGATTSTKINFIVADLLSHRADKTIIFSNVMSDLVFANLADAFELFGITYTIFATGIGTSVQRAANLETFRTSDAEACQALLVDASLGGRGLNIPEASRAIFVEPIWSADLEAQAERRAHRIGQSKSVETITLVIEDTFEDRMLQRRTQIAAENASKAADALHDNVMRDTLQTGQFIETTSTDTYSFDVRLFHPGSADAVTASKGEEVVVPETPPPPPPYQALTATPSTPMSPCKRAKSTPESARKKRVMFA